MSRRLRASVLGESAPFWYNLIDMNTNDDGPSRRASGIPRLSALMFFQFFVAGAFGPILSMYLQSSLGFGSVRTGFIMACSAVSSIVAPILSVYVIDRVMPAKRLYVLSHAVLAASAAGMFAARGFGAFLAFYAVNALFTNPSIGMLNAIIFQRLDDVDGSGKNYGAVRVWGTIGWMGAGYLVSGVWTLLPPLFPGSSAATFRAGAFLVAGAGSIACIALAVGLPSTRVPPRSARPAAERGLFPRDAIATMRIRSVAVLAVVYLVSSIMDKMYSFGAAPYLASLGFRATLVPSLLTLGQVTEMVALFGLAALLSRFSYKPVLMLGAVLQTARFLLLWAGVPALGLVGVAMHGFIFACLYSAILMYIDGRADARSRPAVHQLIQFSLVGTATLVGNLLSGALGRVSGSAGAIDYRVFWVFPLAGAVASAALVLVLFKEQKKIAIPAEKSILGRHGNKPTTT